MFVWIQFVFFDLCINYLLLGAMCIVVGIRLLMCLNQIAWNSNISLNNCLLSSATLWDAWLLWKFNSNWAVWLMRMKTILIPYMALHSSPYTHVSHVGQIVGPNVSRWLKIICLEYVECFYTKYYNQCPINSINLD